MDGWMDRRYREWMREEFKLECQPVLVHLFLFPLLHLECPTATFFWPRNEIIFKCSF